MGHTLSSGATKQIENKLLVITFAIGQGKPV